jgi:hypothetical protein
MPNDFASGERARGIHYLPNRRTIMSPPPRKSSKGKSKCAPDHWSPLPFRGRVSFRHRLLAMQSKRVKHAGRYSNKLPLLCLCLSSPLHKYKRVAVIIFDWDDTICPSSFVDQFKVDTFSDLPLHVSTPPSSLVQVMSVRTEPPFFVRNPRI